ncbi:hypothetical protein [Shimia sp.]|uniref:hypothetical protein n=1 Tax=Shimia sp. TaxID=1954381 RepID=UPI003296963E
MNDPSGGIALILGSGPNAPLAADWPGGQFDHVVAMNNAWRVRPDWTHHIHPEDFAPERRPADMAPDQQQITYLDYIPEQNRFGGVVYAGGTMAFTTGYWALGALRPRVMAFMGCDMVYPRTGDTHFYGTGTADPLREDITLQNLEAKSARLWFLAAQQGCLCVNLSTAPSRLLFPHALAQDLAELPVVTQPDPALVAPVLEREKQLGYVAPTGRYWEMLDRFDPDALAEVDRLWCDAWRAASVVVT